MREWKGLCVCVICGTWFSCASSKTARYKIPCFYDLVDCRECLQLVPNCNFQCITCLSYDTILRWCLKDSPVQKQKLSIMCYKSNSLTCVGRLSIHGSLVFEVFYFISVLYHVKQSVSVYSLLLGESNCLFILLNSIVTSDSRSLTVNVFSVYIYMYSISGGIWLKLWCKLYHFTLLLETW